MRPPLRPRRNPQVSCARVQGILDRLVDAGLVERRLRLDGRFGYTITPLGRRCLQAMPEARQAPQAPACRAVEGAP